MPITPVVPVEGFKYLRANLHCCEDGSSDKLWALYARNDEDHGAVTCGRNGGKMNVTSTRTGHCGHSKIDSVETGKGLQTPLLRRLAQQQVPGA